MCLVGTLGRHFARCQFAYPYFDLSHSGAAPDQPMIFSPACLRVTWHVRHQIIIDLSILIFCCPIDWRFAFLDICWRFAISEVILCLKAFLDSSLIPSWRIDRSFVDLHLAGLTSCVSSSSATSYVSFAKEEKSSRVLPFLDVYVFRYANGRLSTKAYKNETNKTR